MVQALLNEYMKSAEKNYGKPAMSTSVLNGHLRCVQENLLRLHLQGVILGIQTMAL